MAKRKAARRDAGRAVKDGDVVAITALGEREDNAREHTARNIGLIVESLHQTGAGRSVLVDENLDLLAGYGVKEAAIEAGFTRVRVVDTEPDTLVAVRRVGLNEGQKIRAMLFDNRAGEFSRWDSAKLLALQDAGIALTPMFSEEELVAILSAPAYVPEDAEPRPDGDPAVVAMPEIAPESEVVPDVRTTSIKAGEVYLLGDHVLVCGDTTDPGVVGVADGGGAPFDLVHADPPYGMGKEADGIANDNLRGAAQDAFQMRWWEAWLPALAENASAYVWGNAPNLWRLWWLHLAEHAASDLLIRNEIVWDKGSGFGMSSAGAHSYPVATERCLFLMRGQQFLGNQNKDDYWEGYEPLRSWLEAERTKAGWTNGDVNKITKTSMAGHWFGRSQFYPISQPHYDALRAAAKGKAFREGYDALFGRLFGAVRAGGNAHRRDLAQRLREGRTYFDNTHEPMTDVWRHPRVVGEERFGHATPKPVAIVARAIKSSTDAGHRVAVPFGGTGPEVVAAEQLGRRCVLVEQEPTYCQIVVDRWEALTGRSADVKGRKGARRAR